MLLTGGPGTGKTTVIKGIVELYAEVHGLSLSYQTIKKMTILLSLQHQQVEHLNDYKNLQGWKQ